jgi:Ca2+-binding RTX toxin-like protein
VFGNAPAPSLTADAGPDQSAVTQQPVTFIGSADPSADATFAWDLDNDGAFDDAFTAQADTTFAAAGTYTVRLQVTSDGATAVDEAIVNVTNTATDGDTLIIGGTTGADGFVITQNSQGTNVSVNGVAVPFAGNRIVVYGGAGNDMIAVAPNVTAIIEAYGGDGDDRISGGASADILVAGNGDDVVIGFGGRDLLIGGNGADIILGMAADDILVAGFTLHDNDSATLRQISAIWNGSGTYTDRVDTLRAGLFNPDTSVFDDGAVDILAGNSGTDWFLFNNDPAARDRILDRNSSEISTDVDSFVPAE